MNIFRVTSCPEDFPDPDFPGNYPSDEKISGNRPLNIFDSACNAFNFLCLSQIETRDNKVNLPSNLYLL